MNNGLNIHSGETNPVGGFITLYRKLFQGPLWNEKRTYSRFEAWIDLIQMARWQEEPETKLISGNFIKIYRGQLAASIRFLGERWNWDKNKVNRFLLKLENEKALRRPKSGCGTVLELINYNLYNKVGQQQGQAVGQMKSIGTSISKNSRDSNGTANGKTEGQRRDSDEDKCNNSNKDKNDNKEDEQSNKPIGFDEAEASSPDKDSFLKSLEEEKSKPIDEQNLKSVITKFIRNHKPSFIEPYQEIWNLFAEEKGFPKLIKLTASRKKKFASRVKDPAFDFPTILKKANQSEFIAQGNWFGFDWIIENDTNFLKVLEGKYDKKQSDEQNQPNKQNENIKKKVRAVA